MKIKDNLEVEDLFICTNSEDTFELRLKVLSVKPLSVRYRGILVRLLSEMVDELEFVDDN